VRISEDELDVWVLRDLHATPEQRQQAANRTEAMWLARRLLDPDEAVEIGLMMGWSGGEMSRRVLEAVADGRLLVVCKPLRTREVPAPPRPLALAGDDGEYKAPPEQKLDWFFVQIEDIDGRPLANRRYELVTADGKTRSGVSNAQGIVHVTGIPPGTCKFKLVDQDAADWQAV
jgi:hypothetical protein